MNRLFTKLIAVCCFFTACNAKAQQKNTDSVQHAILTSNTEAAFNKNIGRQSWLNNGLAYHKTNLSTTSNAYFKDTTNLINGIVKYYGIVYKDIPLLYDTNQGLLISHLQKGILLYKLQNEHISFFDLMGHHFINLQPYEATRLVPVGFYDELYKNKLQLLVKRYKNLQNNVQAFAALSAIYFTENTYYLKKGDKYYDVNSKGDLLNILQDKKRELKKYIKDNNINYRDNPEQALMVLVNYYDSLTN